ncbi:MAG: glycosyltransferase [candidate division WOR-3 bacterium]|nr:glycosyltransferase [candidate division WOR-3 bacterium]MCX7947118.1 glycosyltransferase [candidate division WOR-3 bacterium]MDW8149841.1 glycosyltransferase [candidate division WOR-3 bacterium]
MKILILSPWENDWNENVVGAPLNYYLLNELRKYKNTIVDWVFCGSSKYKPYENINFINFRDFKASKYDLIIAFSHQFHNIALEISREHNIPYINEHFGIVLNPLVWNINSFYIKIRYKQLLNSFKKQANFYIIWEDGTNGSLFAMLLGIPSYKIKLYEHPKPDFLKIEPVYRKEGCINVGYCGAISKYKGEKIILEIFEKILKYKNIHLIVLLKGENKKLYKLQGKYKNITIISNLPYFQNYKFYSSIDFLINPVHYGNMTLPTIEALFYSKPVIAFDISIWTKIKHLENGILVRKFDIDEFVNSVYSLSKDEALLKKLSKNASKTLENTPTFSHLIEEKVKFLLDFKI